MYVCVSRLPDGLPKMKRKNRVDKGKAEMEGLLLVISCEKREEQDPENSMTNEQGCCGPGVHKSRRISR